MSDGYTLKEMIHELRTNQQIDSGRSIKILEHASNVDKHLDQLNSKVAKHEKAINNLTTFQTKAMMVWGFAVFVIVTVFNKII